MNSIKFYFTVTAVTAVFMPYRTVPEYLKDWPYRTTCVLFATFLPRIHKWQLHGVFNTIYLVNEISDQISVLLMLDYSRISTGAKLLAVHTYLGVVHNEKHMPQGTELNEPKAIEGLY